MTQGLVWEDVRTHDDRTLTPPPLPAGAAWLTART